MDFTNLHQSLTAELRRRVQGGELTERRLAVLSGLSQPHVHNVLNGKRSLSLAAADRILGRLRISLRDLWPAGAEGAEMRWRDVPVLAGRLEPGAPFPRVPSREQFRFSPGILGDGPAMVACQLGTDGRLRAFQPGDFVVLEATLEESGGELREDSYYAVCWRGEGAVRRCRRVAGNLEVLDDGGTAERLPPCVAHPVLEGRVAAVVRLDPRAEPRGERGS